MNRNSMKVALGLGIMLATLSGTTSAHTDRIAICEEPELKCGVGQHQSQPKVEVVFVLDTTGSMGGLIEGAKQKIWSIASEIAQAQPAPELKMGLVGYRDRGDDYVVRQTSMTDDLDTVYADLMEFKAAGGGDTPESVNEALYESIERFEWSDDPSTLKIVFLVGDAPPKMNYQDDVKYKASCKLAKEKNIIINTIQCGSINGTRKFWMEIAQLSAGAYAAIPHDSGVQHIATPYDDDLINLDRQYAELMIDYGTTEDVRGQMSKRALASRISRDSSAEAAADRAFYNQSAAGKSNLFGAKELVNDLASGSISYDSINKDELPEEYQEYSEEKLKVVVEENQAQRDKIKAKILELNKLRVEFRRTSTTASKDSFDEQVRSALAEQAKSIGLMLGGSEDTRELPNDSETSRGKETD